MSKCPSHVKLTSFELATDVTSDIRNEIELKYKRNSKVISLCGDYIDNGHSLLLPNDYAGLKKQYRAMSKDSIFAKAKSVHSNRSVRDMDVRYLPYCTDYRHYLSPFNYQPPELLIPGERFVFPAKQSDVYSVTLLLWELLNNCVPFVIHDHAELEQLYAANKASLPIFEEDRCIYFNKIFKYGFECDPVHRSMTLHHLIKSLEDIKFDIDKEREMFENSAYELRTRKADHEQMPSTSKFDTDNIYENTADIFANTMTENFTKTSPAINPKNNTASNNASNATFSRSVLDFNKLLSPRRVGHLNLYERSSTLKKRKKSTPNSQNKRNAKEVSENGDNEILIKTKPSPGLNDNIDSQALTEKSAISQSTSVRALQYPEEVFIPQTPDKSEEAFNDKTKTVQSNMLENAEKCAETEVSKSNQHSYRFKIDSYELPEHVIARNNKIRRNTWLTSDQTSITVNNSQNEQRRSVPTADKPLAEEVPTTTSASLNDSKQSNKKLNVSIKIVHKQVSPEKSAEPVSTNIYTTPTNNQEEMLEESPSVMSRVQYFSALQNSNRKNNKSYGRLSEIPFSEASKAHRKNQYQKKTLSASPKINNNSKLLKEVTDIADDIKKCLSNNPLLFKHRQDTKLNESEHNATLGLYNVSLDLNNSASRRLTENKKEKDISILAKKLFDNLNEDTDAVIADAPSSPKEKSQSVVEKIQCIENALSPNNVADNCMFQKIQNKLLTEKVPNMNSNKDMNIEDKSSGIVPQQIKIEAPDSEDMVEKTEDVMRITAQPEYDNEASPTSNSLPKQSPFSSKISL